MRAYALFAGAYGFTPDKCRDGAQAAGLMMNANRILAIKAAGVARGAGAVLDMEMAADLASDVGADPRRVAKMRLDAMAIDLKRKVGGR